MCACSGVGDWSKYVQACVCACKHALVHKVGLPIGQGGGATCLFSLGSDDQ